MNPQVFGQWRRFLVDRRNTESGCNPLVCGKLLSSGIDPVYGIAVCDRFEIAQRRTHRDREMSAATSRDPHVLPKDRCPLIRRHCDEMNVASAPLTDNGLAMCRLHILHPIGTRAEHRYEVTPPLHGRNHHRVRTSAAGCAATDFECGLKPRW